MSDFLTLWRKQDSRYFKVKQEDVTIRSQMEGGYVVTRPRHTRRPRKTFTTGFTSITDANMNLLMNYYDSKKGGSLAFEWEHPITKQRILVRFLAPIAFSYAGMGETSLWDATNIELEEV